MSRAGKIVRRPTKAGAVFHEHRLVNGLRVLIAERHLDPVVSALLWYSVGSRDEREEEAGMSHFLEHMMFKGSARFGKGEVDRLTALSGGSNNAFTTPDHTAYWFELASDRWELALEIEADRMRGLTLDPNEFESEKSVVLEELAMGEDDPWRNLTRQVQESLFTRHPYRRPVIGYPDALKRSKPEQMRAWHERFYHPGNAVLVLSGDLRPTAALRLVRKHFGSIPAGAAPSPDDRWVPELDEPRGEKKIETTWDDSATRVCIAWPSVRFASREDDVFDLISTVLSVGRLSRLYRRMVLGEALATSISTNNDTRRDGGSFWFMAEGARGVSAEKLTAAMDEELGRLQRELVPAAELRRAKSVLDASEAYDGETVSDLAEEVGEYAVDADWRAFFGASERRATVTSRELRDCARKYLLPERRVLGWSLPAKDRRAPKRGSRA
jgi:zinc protease